MSELRGWFYTIVLVGFGLSLGLLFLGKYLISFPSSFVVFLLVLLFITGFFVLHGLLTESKQIVDVNVLGIASAILLTALVILYVILV